MKRYECIVQHAYPNRVQIFLVIETAFNDITELKGSQIRFLGYFRKLKNKNNLDLNTKLLW